MLAVFLGAGILQSAMLWSQSGPTGDRSATYLGLNGFLFGFFAMAVALLARWLSAVEGRQPAPIPREAGLLLVLSILPFVLYLLQFSPAAHGILSVLRGIAPLRHLPLACWLLVAAGSSFLLLTRPVPSPRDATASEHRGERILGRCVALWMLELLFGGSMSLLQGYR